MYSFQSDYLEGCAPAILEELIKANSRQSEGYGLDEYCAEAGELIKKAIGRDDADVHFIPGGTPCNILAISSALRPHEAVIAASTGHISVHETGAIEATGHKVIELDSKDGKVNPLDVIRVCEEHGDEHMVKPRMLFVSNPTELGTIYTLKEVKLLREICNRYGLYFYLDGARLANALAYAGNDLSLEDIADIFDVFYIGGTKNGALLGEALVIVNDELKPEFRYQIKQKGQMLAKGRIMGINFRTLFTNDLYLDLAKHANKTAAALKYVFGALNVREYVDSPTNQIFVILDDRVIDKLHENYGFLVWRKYDENRSICRFVTSWNTREEAILEFAQDLREALK
ncbi:MAG: aminotransferase class I/II-fold pyridoxal phosphate-dependent enzyme [Erysipelotrichaceae bacterium]|nr:aminotransferase class I/II-fold pyridoxal phosphate-dependent enzyme [Erysipelotrichaceae bacterium]